MGVIYRLLDKNSAEIKQLDNPGSNRKVINELD